MEFDPEVFETVANNLHNNDFEVGEIVYLMQHPGGYRYGIGQGVKCEITEKQGDGVFIFKVLDRHRVIGPEGDPAPGEDILMFAHYSVLMAEATYQAILADRQTHLDSLKKDRECNN